MGVGLVAAAVAGVRVVRTARADVRLGIAPNDAPVNGVTESAEHHANRVAPLTVDVEE